MRIHVDLFGGETIERDLLGFADRGEDMSPAYEEVFAYLEDQMGLQFTTEGAAFGTPWAPLAASTIKAKGIDRILYDTGALESSFTDSSDPDAVRDIGPEGAEFGSSNPYAEFHQDGTSRMPRRVILTLDEIHRREIVRTMQTYLTSGGRNTVSARGRGGSRISRGSFGRHITRQIRRIVRRGLTGSGQGQGSSGG